MPVRAPYFSDAHLLIAADCTAYAYGNFHQEFMKNRITLIGCPKLDEGDYREKLTQILLANGIKSLTVARMEVPCCGGMERAAKARAAGQWERPSLAGGHFLWGRTDFGGTKPLTFFDGVPDKARRLF